MCLINFFLSATTQKFYVIALPSGPMQRTLTFSSSKDLQAVQNFAARIICVSRKFDHVTPLLKELHWLPNKIPPPSSGLEQMSKDKVIVTKKIANAWIHVERAIGRMKVFSILRKTLPIALAPECIFEIPWMKPG